VAYASGKAVQSWLQKRRQHWLALEQKLRDPRDKKSDEPLPALHLAEEFRGLLRDLSLARTVMPENRITLYLQTLATKTHEVIFRPPHNLVKRIKIIFRQEVPAIIAQTRSSILAATYLFITSVLLGWFIVNTHPEMAGIMVSEQMVNEVQSGKLWTDDLHNIVPSSLLSFNLITNNTSVTLFAFACGVFFGLGTLYIVVLNGMMLGVAFAFTRQYGLDGALFNFVVAHGLVELSVICLACALGFKIGESIIRPGARTRVQAFQLTVADAGKVLIVIIPFLAGAGFIEGFISPNPNIGLPVRMLVGFAYFALFWFVITGRIWRDIQPDKTV
jgi:uncharacterized membrane protein SpoIIM required for sporulation